MKRLPVFLLLLTLLFVFPLTAAAEDDEAVNIAANCSFSSANNAERFNLLTDRGYYTNLAMHKDNDYWEIDFCEGEIQGMYILWKYAPGEWQLAIDLGTGFSEKLVCSGQFIQEYVPLPKGVRAVRMLRPEASENPFELYSLEIYTAGRLPESVHRWEPTPNSAELMLVSAHQDDELLYFGGSVPYYTGELGLDTVVVYVATCSQFRLHESLNGIWLCGARTYPVFMGLQDVRSENIADARLYWNSKDTTKRLTELLLKYRPQVVVTQDENGEYGHGAHRLMVALLKDAIANAADEQYTAENFPDHGAWAIKKCYLHLYKKNRIVMQWDKLPLDRFGGMTAHEVASLGYKKHESQQQWHFRVALSGHDDCRQFGLYYTTVGEDVEKNDFFENVTLRIYDRIPDASAILPAATQYGHNPSVYTTTDAAGEPMWLRYGEIDGVTAWYVTDSTGTLLQPLRSAFGFADARPDDLATYQSLSAYPSGDLPLYEYCTSSGDVQLVRCAAADEGEQWYAVDQNGLLYEPRTTVDIPRVAPPALPEESGNATSLLLDNLPLVILCLLFAALLSVLVAKRVRKGSARSRG